MNDAQDGKPSAGKPSAGKPTSGTPAGSQLPVVWSPKLDAGEGAAEDIPQAGAESSASSSADETTKAEAGEPVAGSGAPASPRQPSRFMLLAASVAIAAAAGALFGSLSASGFAYLMSGSASKVHMSDSSTLQAGQALKVELAEFSALKANLDNASKNANGQFAKLADRLDRVERAEAEPATKLSHIADAVDRLEKRSLAASAALSAPETTGSIASSAPVMSAAPAASEVKAPDRVLQDWVVQDVRGNRALVASRYGGMFAVAAGGFLPGLGRVETIKREDGRWVVVTGRGLITSER
jgi:hypothetical protein